MAEISSERKVAYYLGAGLTIAGFILFLSFFAFIASQFGSDDDVATSGSKAGAALLRAVAGMFLMMVGSIVRGVGARGVAGSGLVLNPKKAKKDLKPYSEMVGGMVGDALREVSDTAEEVEE